MEMEPLRLRLKFEDSVLTDSQKLDGLKRSWVLVEPGHKTIADFVSYLLHSFDLLDSCPDGISLSMEGFILPHFESIGILKNNDLVCVKRKGSKLLVEEKVQEKLPLNLGVPLSTIEVFEKETEGYESETEEEDEDNVQTDLLDEDRVPNGDASIKKRKAPKQLKNTKKKRKCKIYDSSSNQKEHSDSYLQNGHCQPKPPKSKQDQGHNAVCSNIENWQGAITLSSDSDETVKVSVTRSTRRKKAKKLKWRKAEQLYKKQSLGCDLDAEDHSKGSDLDSGPEDEIVPVVVRPGHIRFTAPGKEKDVQQYQEAEGSFNWHGITKKKKVQNWGKEKQTPSKWNENKAPYKKQQASKWKECRATQDKQPASKWNEQRSSQEKQSAYTWGGNRSIGEWQSGSNWNNIGTHGRSWSAQKTPANTIKDYEKLLPLTDFPVQGDVIAYRLLDVNSSLCPELTSYRVGKVSSSDRESNSVVLVPVPEYPFKFKKATDGTPDELADASRYKEDGTLEIDFPSLVDVRIVNRGGLNSSTASGWKPTISGVGWWTVNTEGSKLPSSQAQSSGNKWTETSSWAPASCWGSSTSESGWRTETPGSSKDPQTSNNWTATNAAVASNNWTATNAAVASTSENGDKDVWEELSAAMSAKKAALDLIEDNWNKKRKPANYTWSYRTLRSRA